MDLLATSTRKRPDILNIFVMRIPTNINYIIKNLLDLCTDHTTVFLSFDALPSFRLNKVCLTSGFTNWNKFREIIYLKINLNTSLKTPNDNMISRIPYRTLPNPSYQLHGVQLFFVVPMQTHSLLPLTFTS